MGIWLNSLYCAYKYTAIKLYRLQELVLMFQNRILYYTSTEKDLCSTIVPLLLHYSRRKNYVFVYKTT